MNKLCPFFVLALAAFAFAAVERYSAEQKPPQFADQQGCYVGSLNLFVPVDRPYYPKDGQTCSRYVCTKDSGETLRETCGLVGIGPGCVSVEDFSKNYPDCCPDVKCETTTAAPTTEAATTVAPTTEAAPSARAEANAGPGATASATSQSGQPPVTSTTTTPAPTTAAPTTAAPTTAAPTTTTVAPTTEAAPPSPDQSYASASATSQSGQPPVTRTFATPGAQAQASAT